MTSGDEGIDRTALSTDNPLSVPSFMSETTRSTRFLPTASSASRTVATASTWYPALVSRISRYSRIDSSSSTINIRTFALADALHRHAGEQRNHELGAARRRRGHVDGAVVRTHDGVRGRQAQAGASLTR